MVLLNNFFSENILECCHICANATLRDEGNDVTCTSSEGSTGYITLDRLPLHHRDTPNHSCLSWPILNHQLKHYVCLWIVGETQSTQRQYTQAQGQTRTHITESPKCLGIQIQKPLDVKQ